MLPDFSLPESKRHLQWRHKGAERAKEETDEDIQFDFSDLLSDLRQDLQAQKDTEERLVAEIRRELENAASTVGDKNFTRSFDQSVARLQSYAECVEIDARQLASSLKSVAGLADNISGRVSALDVAKGRVVECLQRVGDLRDLRTCAEGVEAAMKNEEYDEAARNIHRFLTLDTAVFKMGEQIDAKDGGQSLKHSYEVLRQAATSLKEIIERKFDDAVEADDVASMERYFKLFPLINEHASGLQRFGKYLCSKIEKMGDDNFKIMQVGGTDDKRRNVLYADTLTLLFEGIVRLIQLHQPLIDSFYGPDKLLNLIEILQAECDKQALRVINEFIQKRQFEVKTKQVDGYVRGFERAGKMDAIELDVLLSEVTLMHTRAELYWRFLKRRVGEAPARPLSESHDDSPDGRLSPKHLEEDVFVEEMTEEERKAADEKVKTQRKERNKKLDTLLNRSALGTKMQEILGKYVLMEQYYMTESVKKALEMDEVEDGTLTSSMLDDVFFIVRKCIRRSITSSSVDCVCAMLNNGVTLLETEFIKQLNGPIKARSPFHAGYPSVSWTAEAYQTAQSAYQTAQTMLTQHGKSASEAGPERQRSAFLLALNNLRSSVECIQTLKSGLNDDFQRHLNQINTVDKGKLEHSTSQFDDLCKRIEHLSAHGIVKLCEAAFKPKLKTSSEAYLDLTHNLSEDDLTDFESVDPFIENFIAQLDKHIAHFESLLVPANYQDLLGAVCSETANQLERVIFKCVFNRLGGLQLDKEFRQLTNYLTSIAGWSMREKCARLSQIVSLLNSETIDEAVEFYHQINSDTSVSSSLTPNELKKTLILRSDFPREKVKSVKL